MSFAYIDSPELCCCMDKRLLIGVFSASIFAHLVVFWPSPISPLRSPSPSQIVHVQLGQRAAPSEAVAAELSVADGDIGSSVPTQSPQSKGTAIPSTARKEGVQRRSHSSDLVTRGVAKEEEFLPVLEEGRVDPKDLQAYKFALASAALELILRTPRVGEPVLRGTTVVDIHLDGASKIPLVALADSSGAEIVDVLALQMVRQAIGRVAAPTLSEGARGVVRLSVVFEAQNP
mgnify:CR=1 FL=1